MFSFRDDPRVVAGETRHEGVRRSWLLTATVALALVMTGCGDAPPPLLSLDEPTVRVFLEDVDRAVVARDIDGMVEALAPDVEVVQVGPGPNGPQRLVMNRDTYRSMNEQALALVTDYDYSRETRSVEIGDDGASATVRSTIRESVTMAGRSMTSVTEETTWIELRDGRPRVVRVEADVSLR